MEKEADVMMNVGLKKDWKICLPPYKMLYSLLFIVILSLIRGISDVYEIGGAVDSYMALLAIIICSDVYVMEYRGKRWEVFSLFPLGSKVKAVYRRLGSQILYLSLLSYVGYWFFFWQKPLNQFEISPFLLYGMFLAAAATSIAFWGTLSMTLSNLCRNMWAGVGISMILWMGINSKRGAEVLGDFNVFAFSFCDAQEFTKWNWMWGKGTALLIAAVMLAAVPIILKKSG